MEIIAQEIKANGEKANAAYYISMAKVSHRQDD